MDQIANILPQGIFGAPHKSVTEAIVKQTVPPTDSYQGNLNFASLAREERGTDRKERLSKMQKRKTSRSTGRITADKTKLPSNARKTNESGSHLKGNNSVKPEEEVKMAYWPSNTSDEDFRTIQPSVETNREREEILTKTKKELRNLI